MRAAVRPLADSAVTPNHLTTLRLLTGLAAAAAFAVGHTPWLHYGSALLLLSFVLDRADGELARMTGKATPAGHTYDLVSDAVVNASIFIGLGVGLRGGELGHWPIALGLCAGTAVAVVLWLVMRVEELQGARAAELANAGGFDADDAVLIVPIAVSLGGALALIVTAAILAPAVALAMFIRLRHRLHGAV